MSRSEDPPPPQRHTERAAPVRAGRGRGAGERRGGSGRSAGSGGPGARASGRKAARAAIVLLGIVVLLVTLARVRLADAPLERDEGEYAYAGQLILQGTPPYEKAYNMKFPGIYYAYALIMALLGETPSGIRWGLLGFHLGAVALLYLLARRLGSGPWTASIAASTYAILAAGPSTLGLFAHASHFAALPALGGLLVLLRAHERGGWLEAAGSGALLSLAVLMRQHAVFFLAFGFLLLLAPVFRGRRGGGPAAGLRAGGFLAGAAVPVAATLLVLALQGVLGAFGFWTWSYAREYASRVPLEFMVSRLVDGFRVATASSPLLWLIAAAGLAAVVWKPRPRGTKVFILGWAAASFLTICPGLYFRPHYFILLAPVVGLLVGEALELLAGRWSEPAAGHGTWWAPGAAFALVVLISLYPQRQVLFSMTPPEAARAIYSANPFPEAVEVARYIRERTTPADRIAVLGSEPQIYFYARRLSATGFIYAYPLMEPHRFAKSMQKQMREEIEAAHPAYLVVVRVTSSWLANPDSDLSLVDWGQRYIDRCYELVGLADILDQTYTRYAWDAEARAYTPQSTFVVYTFRRKSDAPCSVGPPP